MSSQRDTGAAGLLDDLIGRITALPTDAQEKLTQDVLSATSDLVWCPNPGPQALALESEADELFYGGEAGGGKSDLLIGLSLTGHRRSLILRRQNKDAKDLAKRARDVAGDNEKSFNGQDLVLTTTDGREIEFGGCQYEDDKERRKGRARDFYGFDEGSDFTESQFKFITTWNRSTVPGQRCRVVVAGNPPTRPEGLWVVKYWAAWLDPKHPKPAKPGELRWYIRGEHDEDVEVEGRGPHTVAWQPRPVLAKSRTFIPAKLTDNPDLAATDYAAMLDSLPAALRSAYRDGNFGAELKDDDTQVIPTSWVTAAQDRWTPDGWKAFTQTAIACDPAGGGKDAMEIVARHNTWFGEFKTVKGPETKDGSYCAAQILMQRRGASAIIVDEGGGYGGAIMLRLKDQDITTHGFNNAEKSTATTNDLAKLNFRNKRAEAYWRVREALDPDQEGGSQIALPPDDELKADLCAPRWELTQQGIQLESKDDIKKRIGRSPGKGDAVAMCWSEGDVAVKRMLRKGKAIAHESAASHNVHNYGRGE